MSCSTARKSATAAFHTMSKKRRTKSSPSPSLKNASQRDCSQERNLWHGQHYFHSEGMEIGLPVKAHVKLFLLFRMYIRISVQYLFIAPSRATKFPFFERELRCPCHKPR